MRIKSLFTLAILLAFGGITAIQQPVSAITGPDLQSIINGTSYYDNMSTETQCSSETGLPPVGSLTGGVPEPYNGYITRAAQKFNTDAYLVAAVLYWENRGWPDPNKKWATSSAGAKGPMQFLESTWETYQEDGDGDGKKDIDNVADSIFGGAKFLAALGGKAGSPLGTLEEPLTADTLLRAAASYNWGPGNVGGAQNKLDVLPGETRDYVNAVYILISSQFTKSPQSGGMAPPQDSTGPAAPSVTPACSDGSGGTPGDLGTGSGQFIDNTSVTVAKAAEIVAKAQQVAKYTPAQLQGICEGRPNCKQKCERLAAVLQGRTNSGYASANAHWNAAVAKGKANKGDRNVPVGAVLYYDASTQWGHVATYLGNNKIMSNDANSWRSKLTAGFLWKIRSAVMVP